MQAVKKAFRWFVPGVEHAEDGRERWPSRLSFLLASMGLAVGIGNLLRYPSIAFRNSGGQWFIPYIMALVFVGIPMLLLEVSIGQAYRGGSVVAFNRVSHRLRGLGLSTVYIGYFIATYYVIILSWVMVFFRHSFQSPLPWKGGAEEIDNFFANQVIRNVDPEPGNSGFLVYPGTSVIGETVGWAMLLWLLVYLSIFKGVSLTGRIVYFSMLFPLIMLIVILIRAVTLENAGQGIEMYIGSWHSDKLRGGKIWRDAVGQIFFSIGTGFGSFIAYASYNNKYANAVQDTLIVALSNSFYEFIAGFAAFAVLGFLNISEDSDRTQNTFTVAFVTYPQALAQLPGGHVWAIFFFLTVALLGIDSAFGLVEGAATIVVDTDWGKRVPRWIVVLIITTAAALISIMYTTEFGSFLLDAVDKWFNEVSLILAMWVQAAAVTSVYRYKDVVSQTGWPAFLLANCSYVLSMVLLVLLGHLVKAWVGVLVFFLLLLGGTAVSVLLSKQPNIPSPAMRGSRRIPDKLFWLTCYSGHQLSKDLNVIVARGKNWSIPFFWAPMLRWLTAPVLMVTLSFSYSEFQDKTDDPLQIFGFLLAHVVAFLLVIGVVFPRAFQVWVSREKKDDHLLQYSSSPGEVIDDVSELPTKQMANPSMETGQANDK